MTAVLEPQRPTRDADSSEQRPSRRPPVVTRAETAECTCPDACERDHERD